MIAVLLSCGCHPVSGRPRMNPGCARAAELAPRWSEVGCRQHLGRGGGAVGRTTVEIVRTAVAHCESVHAGESDRR